MLVNIKVYKPNHGNKKAVNLYKNQKHVVIDVNYNVANGNEAYIKLFADYPDIKNNWEIVYKCVDRFN